jgi:hypothetical protein
VSGTAVSDPKRDRDVLVAAARARVAEADSHGVARPDEVAAAGELLADLWQVGTRHGIIPAAWGDVTSLPCACLDVILRRERVRARTRQERRPSASSAAPGGSAGHEPQGGPPDRTPSSAAGGASRS